MDRSNNFYTLASLLVLSLFYNNNVQVQAQAIDITKHGAVADGTTDSAPAMLAAFKEACASPTPSTILIPKGNFFMKQVILEGPCKSPLSIELQGVIKAPPDPRVLDGTSDFFNVRQVNGFNVFGGGSMDGQGQMAWDMKNKDPTTPLMAMFSLAFVTNADIRDVKFVQSKNTHVHIFGCKNLTFTRVTIDSPENSMNTDGIKMGVSSDIFIIDSTLMSGDDCVAILGGTNNLHVTGTRCGPGHGFSVGSMGGHPNEKDITGIHFKNCTLTGTMNGVRIKSWQSTNVALANDISFEDIMMTNCDNPIIIDQEYCPAKNCQGQPPSHVKISKVLVRNVRGTSKAKDAVRLICSSAVPCEDVQISNVDLTFNGGPAISSCTNVKPILSGKLNPPICASAGDPTGQSSAEL